jgi:hypothetical protein
MSELDRARVDLETGPHYLGWRHPILRLHWDYVACPGCRHCGAKVMVRDCPCPIEWGPFESARLRI